MTMLHSYLMSKLGVPFVPINDRTAGHLVLVCDNCPGQNKNRMVIRFVVWLVETVKFKKVSLVFLIVGHTKNPCDRLFNALKSTYRRKNLYCVDDVLKCLSTSPHTTASQPTSSFKDWDTYLDSLYSRPKSITGHHIFEVEDIPGNPNSRMMLKYRRSNADDASVQTQNMAKNVDCREDILFYIARVPQPIPPPGIKPIKKRELSHKYKPYVPVEYHSLDIYQPPTAEETRSLDKERGDKRRNKAARRAP